jgi:hypothetical protein
MHSTYVGPKLAVSLLVVVVLAANVGRGSSLRPFPYSWWFTNVRDPPPPPLPLNSVVDLVVADRDLATLLTAVQTAGLTGVFLCWSLI